MKQSILALCIVLSLGACSPNKDDPNKDEKTPPPKLFEEQRDALDKAKTVEGTQQKQDEEQRKAVEQQTQ